MQVMDLDLNLLVALDRLLATGSVTDAARALGVTQPAMSRTLDRLREALGDPLFVRVGRGLQPTVRARALTGPVAEALAAARRVFASPAPFDPATDRGAWTIAVGDEVQSAFALPILEALWEHAPGLDVRFVRLGLESVDAGRRGEIDLAIAPDLAALPASAGRADLSEFVQRPLYVRRFCVVARDAAPRTLAAYAAAEHLLVGFDGSGRGFVDDLLAEHGLSRRVAATVTSFVDAAHLVARTRLVCLLPEEVVADTALDRAPAPFDVPELPVIAVWHPTRTAEARHRHHRERVMAAVREATHRGARRET